MGFDIEELFETRRVAFQEAATDSVIAPSPLRRALDRSPSGTGITGTSSRIIPLFFYLTSFSSLLSQSSPWTILVPFLTFDSTKSAPGFFCNGRPFVPKATHQTSRTHPETHKEVAATSTRLGSPTSCASPYAARNQIEPNRALNEREPNSGRAQARRLTASSHIYAERPRFLALFAP
ncbi:hypothetical protein A9K55_001001 [Cordyceps militaris]|uniref:Uncharacterized protein n=1 Tax=Cordyceps militaris TaxID=73501 RepID=A0A2H4STE4_CORMI|nr:hypothetical protein A9K55_001001 [Cordyceps militaris]